MNYETFKNTILERMQLLLGPDTALRIQTIHKNNGLKLDGLVISSPNSNLSPTVLLNYNYENPSVFPDFDAICRDIQRTYEQNCSAESMDADFFTDYELIRRHIAYRMINYEKNKELLETVPYVRYLDLAIVFYCLLHLTENGNATILIHKNHLDLWQVTVSQLYEQACQTTPLLLPYDFRNMTAILSDMGDAAPASGQNQADAASFCPMYVLTNNQKLYGAGCMLYPGLLESISEKLDHDLFLLPSSIHEMILLPADNRAYSAELADMVAQINRTELAAEEVLSDQVYYYSRAQQALSICS